LGAIGGVAAGKVLALTFCVLRELFSCFFVVLLTQPVTKARLIMASNIFECVLPVEFIS
jgi:hypothetical protein